MQLMQVKPDQGRLEHPAAQGSFGHREENLCEEEELLRYKYNGIIYKRGKSGKLSPQITLFSASSCRYLLLWVSVERRVSRSNEVASA